MRRVGQGVAQALLKEPGSRPEACVARCWARRHGCKEGRSRLSERVG